MTQLPTDPTPTPMKPDEPGLDAAQQSLSDALRVSFLVLKVLMGALVVVYLFSGISQVDEQNTAVRYRFGEKVGTFGPGWHIGWPYPIEEVVLVPRNTQTVRLDQSFWYDNPDDKKPEDLAFETLDPLKDSFLITGDTNVIHVQFGVSYVITEAGVDQYLRNVGSLERAEELVRVAAERAMIHTIASAKVEDIINKGQFNKDQILDQIVKTLAELETGITVQQVLINNENQSMPNQVREAYISVTKAQAEKVKKIEEARRQYDQTLARAAGGAHEELLTMIRAYESALGNDQRALAEALRGELDRSIAELSLPEPALIEKVRAYQQAVTAAAGSEDPALLASAKQASDELAQALADLPDPRVPSKPIAGEIADIISTAQAKSSEISTRAQLAYERYASALEAYRKTPRVLANDRLQALRESVMTGDNIKVVGEITRWLTTIDPEDVQNQSNADFERREREAADRQRAQQQNQ